MFTVITVNVALALKQRAQQMGCSVADLDVEEGTRFMMAMGDAISGADYAAAIQDNQRLGRLLGEFHQQYDVLHAPTLSQTPIAIGFLSEAPEQEYADRLFGYMGDTGLYNQTGQPSISLPLHWSEDNLPVGMMFTAAYGNDALLLQLATQLEQASPWWDRKPPLYSDKR